MFRRATNDVQRVDSDVTQLIGNKSSSSSLRNGAAFKIKKSRSDVTFQSRPAFLKKFKQRKNGERKVEEEKNTQIQEYSGREARNDDNELIASSLSVASAGREDDNKYNLDTVISNVGEDDDDDVDSEEASLSSDDLSDAVTLQTYGIDERTFLSTDTNSTMMTMNTVEQKDFEQYVSHYDQLAAAKEREKIFQQATGKKKLTPNDTIGLHQYIGGKISSSFCDVFGFLVDVTMENLGWKRITPVIKKEEPEESEDEDTYTVDHAIEEETYTVDHTIKEETVDDTVEEEETVDYTNDKEETVDETVDYTNDKEQTFDDTLDYTNDGDETCTYMNNGDETCTYTYDEDETLDYTNEGEETVDHTDHPMMMMMKTKTRTKAIKVSEQQEIQQQKRERERESK
jgi:hypothetical protein